MINYPFNQFKGEVKKERAIESINTSEMLTVVVIVQTSRETRRNIHNGKTSMWRPPEKSFIAETLSVHNN